MRPASEIAEDMWRDDLLTEDQITNIIEEAIEAAREEALEEAAKVASIRLKGITELCQGFNTAAEEIQDAIRSLKEKDQ